MLLIITISVLILYIILGLRKSGFALITLPVVGVILLIISANSELLAPAIISWCIFPATLVSVLFMRHETDVVPWPKKLTKVVLIMSICIILLVVFSVMVSSLIGVYMGIFMGIFFCYYAGAVITQHNATAVFVISTIGASIRQNLPLPMALQSAAESTKYEHARILRQISKWLVQGYSLSESIKHGFRRCPARITALIAAGEKTGQLPQIVRSIEADLMEKADENKRVKPAYPASYLITVFVFMLFIIMGLSTLILPKFRVIIHEMVGGDIPVSTRVLISITDSIFSGYSWVIFTEIILIAFIYIAVRFRPRRPEKPLLLSKIGDFLKWYLPILHWFENNYSTLQVVEVLRISLNAGCTINAAVAGAINLDINYYFRKKLKKWLKQIEAGEDIAAAAERCGLAKSFSWAFQQQENPESTLSVLEMLESVYRSNYSYKVNLARFILLPSTTVCMGVMVGFVAYSVFAAIVRLICCVMPI